jgi:hypothetical protein
MFCTRVVILSKYLKLQPSESKCIIKDSECSRTCSSGWGGLCLLRPDSTVVVLPHRAVGKELILRKKACCSFSVFSYYLQLHYWFIFNLRLLCRNSCKPIILSSKHSIISINPHSILTLHCDILVPSQTRREHKTRSEY